MTIFILSTVIILILLYGILMYSMLLGWIKIRKNRSLKPEFFPTVSVIIPYRNESKNLSGLIHSLSKQDYASGLLEFIFVNDHSTDDSYALAIKESNKLSGTVMHIQNPEDKQGKKAALRLGSHSCNGDIILLSDADCKFESGWITSMVSPFSNLEIQMVQGPVLIHPEKSLAGNMQQIEFMSLMMSAAGSAGINHPILASGANLAVRRLSYLEGSRELKDHINTGDDMFLLEYFKKKNKKSISFQSSPLAIVRTKSVKTFTQLWNQRKRWTSKSTNYKDSEIFGVAVLVLLINLALISSLLLGFQNHEWILLPVFLWVIKTVIELPLIIAGCRFYSISNKLIWFFVTQLIYPFYIVIIAITGVFGSYKWKKR